MVGKMIWVLANFGIAYLIDRAELLLMNLAARLNELRTDTACRRSEEINDWRNS